METYGTLTAKNALRSTMDAIMRLKTEGVPDEQIRDLKDLAEQEAVNSLKDMEPLNEKQVNSAQKLVSLNHPLSKIELWKALPFLTQMASLFQSQGSQSNEQPAEDDNFQ